MTEEGFVITLQESHPSRIQYLTGWVGPMDTPISNKGTRLNHAKVFSGDIVDGVVERVRDWYDNNMPNHEVEVGTREVEIHMKEK